MTLFLKKRRGIYIYLKNPRDIKKIQKYGHIISFSRKFKYACVYVDDNLVETIVEDLRGLKFVKKVVVSELVDLVNEIASSEKIYNIEEVICE